jgi:hypothetical protein
MMTMGFSKGDSTELTIGRLFSRRSLVMENLMD